MSLVVNPYAYFTDTNGDALNGYLYIGEVGKNAENYPIAIYYDNLLTTPAPNPLTVSAGYIYNGGTIAQIYAAVDYSLIAKTTGGSLVYSSLNESGMTNGAIGTIDEMKDFIAPYNNYALNVLGYSEAGDGGGGLFYYDANSTEDDNGGTIIEPTSGSGRWIRQYSGAVNVKWFGAKGDGIANDTAAIDLANVWLSSSTLLSPRHLIIDSPIKYKGTSKLGAFTLTDVSGFTIEWINGGRLLMDNLVSTLGTTSGLFISGTASNITIINPYIEWTTAASSRSQGDGMTFKGYPSDSYCLNNINIIGKAYIKNAPQAGTTVMGCKNVYVEYHYADTTLADGLHFNACQNVKVGTARSLNNGDDTLAFVTYYNASDIGGGGANWKTSRSPYNQPSLGDWSNFNSTATSVHAVGGTANALRVSGSQNISITSVYAKSKSYGVTVDGGIAGGGYGWTYLASRQIQIAEINTNQCSLGFFSTSFNCVITDTDYTNFDVKIGMLKSYNPTTYGCRLNQVQGISFEAINVNSTATTTGLLIEKCYNINIDKTYLNLAGYSSGISLGNLNKNINFNFAYIDGGTVYINSGIAPTQMESLSFNTLIIKNSWGYGAYISDVSELTIGTLRIYNNNANNVNDTSYKRALYTGRIQKVFINTLIIDVLVSNYITWEFGGGYDANNIAGKDVTLQSIRIRVPAASSGISFQGGEYGPIKYAYNGKWQNTATLAWTAFTADVY